MTITEKITGAISTLFGAAESAAPIVPPVTGLKKVVGSSTSITLNWNAPVLPDLITLRYTIPTISCRGQITQTAVMPPSTLLDDLKVLQATLTSAQVTLTRIINSYN